jgi:DUF4097 and DUF4098 domain-containing protein YvlB
MLKSNVLAMTAILLPFLLFAADLKTSTYSSNDFKRVEIETFNGSILAKASDDDEITVSYSIGTGVLSEEADKALGALTSLAAKLGGLDDLDVDVSKDEAAGVLRIKVNQDDNESITGCNIELMLPKDIYAKLETDNGWITVEGLEKGFDITTMNGFVTMRNTAGDARFNVTNGYTRIEEHHGNVHGSTTNGNIEAHIVLPDNDCDCELSTVNNDIELAVPRTVGAKVSLSTVHGTTAIAGFDKSSSNVDEDLSKTIGDGSGRIKLTTVNGDVLLKELD